MEVLHGISLTIHQGEFVAIMGASGSGKTTLMNILGCLDRPTGGRYLFAGPRMLSSSTASELAWLRRKVFGFVFQSYNLLGTATAAENVEIPAIYAGMPSRERRSAGLPTLLDFAWPWRPDATTGRASFPAASSSASRSRGR